jgi:multiple sugar transport system ATP-binding protein
MASLTLDKLTKVYPNGFVGIRDLDLAIEDGEFLVLVGPSGCGKSTALRMVAGLETITSGTLRIGDEVVNDLEPKERDVAMVFQNYALYPHMTVAQNIGFALKLAGHPKAEIEERVLTIARTLQLEPWLGRKPAQLSGGQRQRVAMGRAIIRDPRVFLMDEPLSNLDAKLRVQMRAEIAHLQRELKTTTLYVTHDQTEAMTMGDRVAVLRDGELQQVAAPEDLYTDPDNVFVGAFIGSPAMNLLEGRVDLEGERPGVLVGAQRLDLPPSLLDARPGIRAYHGRTVVVGLRPEIVSDPALDGDEPPPGSTLSLHIELREALGSELILHAHTDARPARSEDAVSAAVGRKHEESAVFEAPLPGAATDVDGGAPVVIKFDARSRARAGDDITVVVDTERLHLFDLDSGEAIRQ